MTDKQIKVGDVVAWDEVPSGALLATTEREFSDMYALRSKDHCCWVTVDGWRTWYDDETWMPHSSSQWRIIALGLTGQETAAELQRLAEVFDVRESWGKMQRGNLLNLAEAMFYDAEADGEEDEFFEHLHAAGWRPGMTAEDAARLLAE